QIADLPDKLVALIFEIVRAQSRDHTSANLLVERGNLAREIVHLLDIGLDTALQVRVDVTQAVVDLVEAAGNRGSLISQDRPYRVALRFRRDRLKRVE